MTQHKARIKKHADSHEKQQSENVAKRNDVTQGLMTELRFAENDARNESTQGKRQARTICPKSDSNAGSNNRHEEQLARAPSQHGLEQSRQQMHTKDINQYERNGS